MNDRPTADDCDFYIDGRCILGRNCGTINCTFVENTDYSMEAEAMIRAEITRLESLISAPRECGDQTMTHAEKAAVGWPYCLFCGAALSAGSEE